MSDKRPQSLLQSLMGVEILALLLVVTFLVAAVLGADNQRLRRNIKDMTGTVKKLEGREDQKSLVQRQQMRIAELVKQIGFLKEELEECCRCLEREGRVSEAQRIRERARLMMDETRLHDKPPIITLAEADGYYFKSGSAEISDGFWRKLRQDVVPKILTLSAQYGTDIVEIVGHTDEVPVGAVKSSLDTYLIRFINGFGERAPKAGDNVGLGMTRAAAVARVLLKDSRLSNLRVVPLSAGQLMLPNGVISDGNSYADQERRRIEIRLRRSE